MRVDLADLMNTGLRSGERRGQWYQDRMPSR
jgi:hypothetical protein